MSKILVVAPHPDDETLGCGGTLLRHRVEKDEIHWLVMTEMDVSQGYSSEAIAERTEEIAAVEKAYPFDSVFRIGFPTARLDDIPRAEHIEKIGEVFREIAPSHIYIPFPGDIHTDHRITYEASLACTKWFRYPSVRRVLAYETLSETDLATAPHPPFQPNVFVDIGQYLERKIEIMNIYSEEIGEFPFPRSDDAIRALAAVRGTSCGVKAAEAFLLLKEVL